MKDSILSLSLASAFASSNPESSATPRLVDARVLTGDVVRLYYGHGHRLFQCDAIVTRFDFVSPSDFRPTPVEQLIEALALVFIDELNTLRREALLPEHTTAALIDAIRAKIGTR